MSHQRSLFTPTTALVVHFVIAMTAVATAGVCWVLRDAVSIDLSTAASRALRWAAVAELVFSGVAIAHLRSKIQRIAPTEDVNAWWAANGPRVLVTWLLAYGAGVTGAVLWVVTDDVVVLAAVVVAAFLLLMRLSPARWSAEEPAHQSHLAP